MLLLTAVRVNMFSCISRFFCFERDHLPLTTWPAAMWPTHSKSSCMGSAEIIWETETKTLPYTCKIKHARVFSEQQRTESPSSQHLPQAKKQKLGFLVRPPPHPRYPAALQPRRSQGHPQTALPRQHGQWGSLSQGSHLASFARNNRNSERPLAFFATWYWFGFFNYYYYFYFKWCDDPYAKSCPGFSWVS